MEKVDKDKLYKDTLRQLRKLKSDHSIFKLEPKEQIEFMSLLLDGQGYFIREGIKDGIPEIALPGIGTFIYNPLRKIAEEVKKEYANKLYPYELRQLISEKLADYYDNNKDPFVKHRPRPRIFNFDNKDSEIV